MPKGTQDKDGTWKATVTVVGCGITEEDALSDLRLKLKIILSELHSKTHPVKEKS